MSTTIRAAVTVALLALLAACQPLVKSGGSAVEIVAGVEGWIVIVDDPRSERRKGRADSVGYGSRVAYDSDPELARVSARIADEYDVEVLTQWPIRQLDVHCVVIGLPTGTAEAKLAEIRRDSRVRSIQRLNSFETSAAVDPYRELQTSLVQMNFSAVHPYLTGKGVSVGVVDTAVDGDHEDLRAAVRSQQNLVEEIAFTPERHGTGIASVIAATADNGIGITGIAPDARLISYRACWQGSEDSAKGFCNTLTLSRALDRAIEDKPEVLNLSLTGPPDALLEDLLALVLAQGTIVVAAHDETRLGNARFPVARSGVLFGRDAAQPIDPTLAGNVLAAPGSDILTAQPGQTYDILSGNSLAAAHLSGAVALMLEADGSLDAAGLERVLSASGGTDASSSIDICVSARRTSQAINCND